MRLRGGGACNLLSHFARSGDISQLGDACAESIRQPACEPGAELVQHLQGKEADVVIFSCVRAHGRSAGVGFLSDVRRMNVGLTRARRALWILGHSSTLQARSSRVIPAASVPVIAAHRCGRAARMHLEHFVCLADEKLSESSNSSRVPEVCCFDRPPLLAVAEVRAVESVARRPPQAAATVPSAAALRGAADGRYDAAVGG